MGAPLLPNTRARSVSRIDLMQDEDVNPVKLGAHKLSFWREVVDFNVGPIKRMCAKKQFKQILFDINAMFHPGELVALMGPSGAGSYQLFHLSLSLSLYIYIYMSCVILIITTL